MAETERIGAESGAAAGLAGLVHGSRGLDQLIALASATPLEPPVSCFWFLRHGQTEGNLRKIYQRIDQPLDETGEAQAAAAAEKLRNVAFQQIFASTMARAWRTASVVAAATGRPLVQVPDLQERLFGELIGTSSADMDWAVDPKGGETLATFVARTRAGISHGLAGSPAPLLVAHGGSLQVLAASLQVVLPLELLRNAQPLRFERRSSQWTVEAV